jgi:hypothetical protein
VQHPGIDVAEHAVVKAVSVQQGTKLHDEVRQGFRRHGGVFGEGHRLLAPSALPSSPTDFLRMP